MFASTKEGLKLMLRVLDSSFPVANLIIEELLLHTLKNQ